MQYQAPSNWMTSIWSTHPFTQLHYLGLQALTDFPEIKWLNQAWSCPVQFMSQHDFDSDGRYYEEVIFATGQVPTRNRNWHDLFNAAVWAQFPGAKSMLNQQHMQDIREVGLNPRTPRRNRITQFDECGVIITYYQSDVPELLAGHNWADAFVTRRAQWGKQVKAWVFGHANFEMLLNPFIGLTGKWLAIEVDEQFSELSLSKQCSDIDKRLAALLNDNIFASKGALRPLPLLGVPGWYAENKNAEFYKNSAYFMPKRMAV